MEQEMKNTAKIAISGEMYQCFFNLMASKPIELEDHAM